MSKRFLDDGNGRVAGVETILVEWTKVLERTIVVVVIDVKQRIIVNVVVIIVVVVAVVVVFVVVVVMAVVVVVVQIIILLLQGEDGRWKMAEVAGSEKTYHCQVQPLYSIKI